MLVQLSCGGQVALFVRYVALLVDGPPGTHPLAEFLEKARRLSQCPLCAGIVATDLDHVSKIVKTTCNSRPVREQAPACQTTFKIALRRAVITSVSGRNCQSIQRCGYPPLIAQLFVERDTLFQKTLSSGKITLRRCQSTDKMQRSGTIL